MGGKTNNLTFNIKVEKPAGYLEQSTEEVDPELTGFEPDAEEVVEREQTVKVPVNKGNKAHDPVPLGERLKEGINAFMLTVDE